MGKIETHNTTIPDSRTALGMCMSIQNTVSLIVSGNLTWN